MRDVLGLVLWDKLVEIAESVRDNPRTLVKASNSVGKSFTAAAIIQWWYSSFNPGIALSTAPNDKQVVDILWKHIRDQSGSLLPLLPKAPRIEDPDVPLHYAAGYTAKDVNAFQGRHSERILLVFDEAVGIKTEFWIAGRSMVTGPLNRHLAICNPTDTASEAYNAELSGSWNTITVSALDHPNIKASLLGLTPPIPGAVSIEWVQDCLRDWTTPLAPGETVRVEDVQWPPDSGIWYRPGADFEARVLGRWPSQGTNSVWTEALIMVAFRQGRFDYALEEPTDVPCEIGCDVARFGDDFTAIHVRRGEVSLQHESHQGWEVTRTAARLKDLARLFGQRCGAEPRSIAVKVDVDGIGGGVVALRDDYNFVGLSGARRARKPRDFPNRRSESWFAVTQMASEDRVDLSRLDPDSKRKLRTQLMSPKYSIDSQGRREVERKDVTKQRLQRSPDDADALNLAYAPWRHPVAAAGAAVPGAVGMGTQTSSAPSGDKRRAVEQLLRAAGLGVVDL
jgi:hypothetical protein